jgi:copper chaperone CopZ
LTRERHRSGGWNEFTPAEEENLRNVTRITPILILGAVLVFGACQGGRDASAEEVQAAQTAGLRFVKLHVPDMYCMGCVATIQAKLKEAGMTALSADLEAKTVTGYYDPARLTPEAIERAVEEVGYGVESAETNAPEAGDAAR